MKELIRCRYNHMNRLKWAKGGTALPVKAYGSGIVHKRGSHLELLRLIQAAKPVITCRALVASNATFFYARIAVVLRFFIGNSKIKVFWMGIRYCDWLKLSESLRAHGPCKAGSS